MPNFLQSGNIPSILSSPEYDIHQLEEQSSNEDDAEVHSCISEVDVLTLSFHSTTETHLPADLQSNTDIGQEWHTYTLIWRRCRHSTHGTVSQAAHSSCV